MTLDCFYVLCAKDHFMRKTPVRERPWASPGLTLRSEVYGLCSLRILSQAVAELGQPLLLHPVYGGSGKEHKKGCTVIKSKPAASSGVSSQEEAAVQAYGVRWRECHLLGNLLRGGEGKDTLFYSYSSVSFISVSE